MSKKAKKKNNPVKLSTKKKTNKKVIVSLVIALVVCIAVAVVLIIVNSQGLHSQIKNTSWVPAGAKTASGDEVELSTVYNVNYSEYQGSLTFKDNTFEFWLSPGSPDDGTHTGTYTCTDDKIIAVFDYGIQSDFDVVFTDNKPTSIIVSYSDYLVEFRKS